MPNTKTALKRMKKAEVRRQRNRHVKSQVKTAIKRFEEALMQGDVDAAREKLLYASKIIDKASAKGVLHKNNAARKKSLLARKFNKLIAS